MSDARDDLESLGRLAVRGSQLEPLRERMRAFVDEREPVDLRDVRERTASDPALSELVREDRDGRLD